jgi:hypothetical protein
MNALNAGSPLARPGKVCRERGQNYFRTAKTLS